MKHKETRRLSRTDDAPSNSTVIPRRLRDMNDEHLAQDKGGNQGSRKMGIRQHTCRQDGGEMRMLALASQVVAAVLVVEEEQHAVFEVGEEATVIGVGGGAAVGAAGRLRGGATGGIEQGAMGWSEGGGRRKRVGAGTGREFAAPSCSRPPPPPAVASHGDGRRLPWTWSRGRDWEK